MKQQLSNHWRIVWRLVPTSLCAFKKNLLTEDRRWLFLKSSFQIQGLCGRLVLINTCMLTVKKFLSSAKMV